MSIISIVILMLVSLVLGVVIADFYKKLPLIINFLKEKLKKENKLTKQYIEGIRHKFLMDVLGIQIEVDKSLKTLCDRISELEKKNEVKVEKIQ